MAKPHRGIPVSSQPQGTGRPVRCERCLQRLYAGSRHDCPGVIVLTKGNTDPGAIRDPFEQVPPPAKPR